MNNTDFRKILTYGSVGVVAIVALVFSTEQSLPGPREHASIAVRPIATPGHTDPWALRHPVATARPAMTPHDGSEPDPAGAQGAHADPTAGEPNHRDRLPSGGIVGDQPADGDHAAGGQLP